MENKIISKLLDITNNIMEAEKLIELCSKAATTKKEAIELMGTAIPILKFERERLVKYINALDSNDKNDVNNTIEQDLRCIKESIGTAQFHLMNNDINGASSVLSEIDKMLS